MGQPPEEDPLQEFLRICRRRRHLHEAHAAAVGRVRRLPPLGQLYTARQARQLERGIPPERGLTQEQTAWLIGRSTRTWTAYEQGDRDIPERLMPLVADVLGMAQDERPVFYRLRFHRDPPPTLAEPDPELVDPQLRAFLADHPYPGYIADLAWNRIVENRAFDDWFPYAAPDAPSPERNMFKTIMRPESRARLVDRDTRYAIPLFQQIWSDSRLYPDNPSLAAIIAEVRGNPQWKRICWRKRNAPRVPHIEGDIRLFRHDTRGTLRVALIIATSTSLSAVGYRMVFLRPVD